MRNEGGRPSIGMCPRVITPDGHIAMDTMSVLIIPNPVQEKLAEFKHIVRSIGDPNLRQEKAVKLMSAAYFQSTIRFNDRLTAVFSPGSDTANTLTSIGQCQLSFSQFNQTFDLACDIERLSSTSEEFQITWWHNLLFNPHLEETATILGFLPNWQTSTADPVV
jgi:hypothetical protein